LPKAARNVQHICTVVATCGANIDFSACHTGSQSPALDNPLNLPHNPTYTPIMGGHCHLSQRVHINAGFDQTVERIA